MFDEVWLMMDGWESSLYHPPSPLPLSLSSVFPVSALGSPPFLSLKNHHDSVNLSCSSCGWFPKPSLLWKFTNEKGETLSDPQSRIYSRQENGLFCIYSWVILSSSLSNSISCSVSLSEDKKRNVSMDLGARQSGLLRIHYKYTVDVQ